MRDSSLRASILFRGTCGRLGVDLSAGSIGGYKNLIRHAANVSLSDFVDLIKLLEQLAPVAVSRLVLGERGGEALVVIEAAQELGTSPGLVHLKLCIGDVSGFQLFNLLVDGIAHLCRSVAGTG